VKRRRRTSWVAGAIVAGTVFAARGSAQDRGFESLPYTSTASSEFDLASGGFFLEDFEDGVLDTPGVVASGGRIVGPGGDTDSVDGDDGAVDGSGTNGHAYRGETGRVRFVFDPAVLGALPNAVGIVVTEGIGRTQVFVGWTVAGGGLSRLLLPLNQCGETHDDRFYPFTTSTGIAALEISSGDGTPVEVDHLQYSAMSLAPIAPRSPPPRSAISPSQCAPAADLLWSRVEGACPCAEARSRHAYLRCAKRAVVNAIHAKQVSRACRAGALTCAKRSTCGVRDAVTCCASRTGEQRCTIEGDAASCARRGGVVGAWPSCCVACASTPCFPIAAPALTASECQARKLDAWADLRACRATERAIQVDGQAGDPTRCDRPFGEAIAAASVQAAASGVPCRFHDPGDGTLRDLQTALVWERKPSLEAAEKTTWATAMSDVPSSADGSSLDGARVAGCLAGRCDWRLPSIADLLSTLTIESCISIDVPVDQQGPCIDPAFGPTLRDRYWTATLAASAEPPPAWTVDFGGFQGHAEAVDALRYTRVVRGGSDDWPSTPPAQAGSCAAAKVRALGEFRACRLTMRASALRGATTDPAACDAAFATARANAEAAGGGSCRFLDNGNDTVTDLDTGLTWERQRAATVTRTADWRTAMANVVSETNGRSYAVLAIDPTPSGVHDWRLPTVAELAALIEVSAPGCASGEGPCIDPVFGATGVAPYWSATGDAGDAMRAWAVGFEGPVPGPVRASKDTLALVRLVRGDLD
jgi:hypothetical protein